jgi:hypothetical protein
MSLKPLLALLFLVLGSVPAQAQQLNVKTTSKTMIDHPALRKHGYSVQIDRNDHQATVHLWAPVFGKGNWLNHVAGTAQVGVDREGRVAGGDATLIDRADPKGMVKKLTGMTLGELLKDVRLGSAP